MNNCPFCSGLLLRHIRGFEVYYFCRNCWHCLPALDFERHTLSPLVSSLSRKRLRGELGDAAVDLC